jgi:hypothetical protein
MSGERTPWSRSRRPTWVRAANALGRGAQAVGARLPRLDADALLADAMRRTGLDDFGDPAFREPLAIFSEALEAEAALTPLGRFVARHELRTLLENRLRIEETWKRQPEIERETVAAPIFVTGTGRSGTSILHELLAQDPRHRVLLSWEALHPCPPPTEEGYEDDPRIRIADREVKLWERIAPIYRTMHENGARVPQECIYLTAHEFASDLLSGNYAVPSYAAWLGKADLRVAYRTHQRLLKLLQSRRRRERWVLKAPSHLWSLEALLAVYPDARIVQTHRDPLAVIASMTSLMATLLWIRSDRVDPGALGPRTVRSVAFMLQRASELRDRGLLPPQQVHDVRYQDFLADPIAAVADVYDAFGVPFSAEAESRMRAYLAAKPQGRHGVHAWRFEDTGIDADEARERFAPYRERFGVPSEV